MTQLAPPPATDRPAGRSAWTWSLSVTAWVLGILGSLLSGAVELFWAAYVALDAGVGADCNEVVPRQLLEGRVMIGAGCLLVVLIWWVPGLLTRRLGVLLLGAVPLLVGLGLVGVSLAGSEWAAGWCW